MDNFPVGAQTKRTATPGLTLTDALASLRAAGVGLPEVLRLAQSGDVVTHRLQDSVRLSDLRFDAASIDAFLARHAPAKGEARYTSTEACRLLCCTQVTLRLWAAGLLISLGTRDPAAHGAGASDARGRDRALPRLRHRPLQRVVCGAEEAATILGCHPTTLHA